MFSKLAIAAVAATLTASSAFAIGAHPTWGADTYLPKAAISKIVGSKQIVGYFTADTDACRMTLMVAEANDEMLAVQPMRIAFTIPAADVAEFQTDARTAMRVACTADADQIKIVTFQSPTT